MHGSVTELSKAVNAAETGAQNQCNRECLSFVWALGSLDVLNTIEDRTNEQHLMKLLASTGFEGLLHNLPFSRRFRLFHHQPAASAVPPITKAAPSRTCAKYLYKRMTVQTA